MTRRIAFPVGILIVALILAACEAAPTGSPQVSGAASAPAEETPVPTPAPPPPGGRLALVQGRGELICGINGGLPGFSFLDQATGENTGFDADFCRAVAAAVLGDPEAVEFRALTADQRSTAI